MNDLTRICIISPAESALRKLKKHNIGVYNCEKDGARFIFSVKDKHIKKVFALFNKPCYNIFIKQKSLKARSGIRLFNRIGLLIGGAIFVFCAFFTNSFIFKISVDGSGAYLEPEVKRIIYESGVEEFTYFSDFDYAAATGKILSLPQVTFCNIKKRGSVLTVDVEVNEAPSMAAKLTPLKADRGGKVRGIAAICGTACVKAGDEVRAGDILIDAYTFSGEERIDSIAVGYAELECRERIEYFASEESEENLKSAYSSILLYSDEILSRAHTVKSVEGGVAYVIDFTYLHKLIINMN